MPVFTSCSCDGAADFPKGPITYIIPFNPGGQSDVEARLQQPQLEKNLGCPSSSITCLEPGGLWPGQSSAR